VHAVVYKNDFSKLGAGDFPTASGRCQLVSKLSTFAV
jgi:hypothetical protein